MTTTAASLVILLDFMINYVYHIKLLGVKKIIVAHHHDAL